MLYLALAATAAIENFFPPLPADTVVAFGSFLAARGEATAIGAFLSTWLGNVGGAFTVYWLGRKYGASWLERGGRLRKFGGARSQERVRSLYSRYGLPALFLSRFLPGVRAIVPPFAGALGVPFLPVAAAIALASGIWYGFITYLAYRVGANWEALQQRISEVSTSVALVAAGIVCVALVGWLSYRLVARRR